MFRTDPNGMGSTPCSILIIEECRLLCDALAGALSVLSWVRSVSGVYSLTEALEVSSAVQPEIVLLSMQSEDPEVCVAAFRQSNSATPIIAVSVAETEAEILACAELGVAGMLPRTGSLDDLEMIVASVMRGETVCSPRVAGVLLRRVTALATVQTEMPSSQDGHLTPREREVLTLIKLGWSNKQIAQNLRIEVRTVKNHVHNLLEKLRVTRRGEAAARVRSIRLSAPATLRAAGGTSNAA